MDNYQIELSLGERQPNRVRLNIQATDFDSANALAEALTRAMPMTQVWSSKQETYVDATWYVSEVFRG